MSSPKPAFIETIFIASKGSAPMRRLDEVEAVAGGGIRGDRYCERSGYWTAVDECQVTLIEAEALEEIAASGVRVLEGEHRRNLVTRGVRLDSLCGKRFQVGGVILEYDRPRPPCGYIQSITQAGMTQALMGRGGICARVVEGGVIRERDSIAAL